MTRTPWKLRLACMFVFALGVATCLEEALVHEAAHTSFDAAHANSPGWIREDIAETLVPYLAVRYRSDRISRSLANTILATIPNRLAYLDSQSFDIHPIGAPLPTAR